MTAEATNTPLHVFRPHLVMDNHPAHTTPTSLSALSESFYLQRLPKYSSQLNSIEYMWSIIKRRVKKIIACSAGSITSRDVLVSIVSNVLDSINE